METEDKIQDRFAMTAMILTPIAALPAKMQLVAIAISSLILKNNAMMVTDSTMTVARQHA